MFGAAKWFLLVFVGARLPSALIIGSWSAGAILPAETSAGARAST
jgi:hypothetical protein